MRVGWRNFHDTGREFSCHFRTFFVNFPCFFSLHMGTVCIHGGFVCWIPVIYQVGWREFSTWPFLQVSESWQWHATRALNILELHRSRSLEKRQGQLPSVVVSAFLFSPNNPLLVDVGSRVSSCSSGGRIVITSWEDGISSRSALKAV